HGGDRLQQLVQGEDPDGRCRGTPQVPGARLGEGDPAEEAGVAGGAPAVGVVGEDDVSVAGEVGVRLQGGGACLQGAEEGGEGVLRKLRRGAAVGVQDRHYLAFLPVGAGSGVARPLRTGSALMRWRSSTSWRARSIQNSRPGSVSGSSGTTARRAT